MAVIKKRENEPLDNKKARIQLRMDQEEKNLFRDENTRRLRIEKRSKTLIVLAICLLLALVFSVLLSINIFVDNLSVALYFEVVIRKVQDLAGFASGSGATNGIQFIIYRYLIIALVGAALAASGAVYQGSFRNALASPTTLGVQSGGMLGGVLYIFLFTDSATFSVVKYQDQKAIFDAMDIVQKNSQSLSILAGCLISVFLTVAIARAAGRGKVSSLALILTGAVFGSVINGGVGLFQYYMLLTNPYDSRFEAMRVLMMGTFDNTFTLQHLILVGVPIGICLIIITLLRPWLNVLVFGEEEARILGLRVGLFTNVMVGICTVMVAVVISFCGQIGFVGFIIPHIARIVVGVDYRYLLPASMLLGSIAMVVVYNVAASIGLASNINVVTSMVGGSLFLIIVLKYRRNRNADWA